MNKYNAMLDKCFDLLIFKGIIDISINFLVYKKNVFEIENVMG